MSRPDLYMPDLTDAERAAFIADETVTPPKTIRDVPLRPCPKCGGRNVWVRYCDACRQKVTSDLCSHGEAEHFHRGCRQCSYGWRTDDVNDARVMCDR